MMSTNKSIDGLSTKSQKKRSPHVPTMKTRGFTQLTPDNLSEKLTEVETQTALPADDVNQNSKSLSIEPTDLSTKKETTDFLAPVQAFDFDSETGELTSVKPKTMKKKNPSPKSIAKKKAKKKTKIRRIIAIICLMLVLFVASVVIWVIFW